MLLRHFFYFEQTVNQQTNAEKATHTTTTTTAINSTASSAKLIHVTIMPCPDKKLEASRRDFFEAGEEPDVNLVLTTTEVLEMITSGTEKNKKNTKNSTKIFDVIQEIQEMKQQNEAKKKQEEAQQTQQERQEQPEESIMLPRITATTISLADIESIFPIRNQSSSSSSTTTTMNSTTAVSISTTSTTNISTGNGSGGYLDYIFRRAAKELFNVVVDGPLLFQKTKNPDLSYTELIIDGTTVLKFAKAYGFRSIQTVVRQLKRKKCRYDYIEVMACPSGCLNGGGQIRGSNSMQTKEILKTTKLKFHETNDATDVTNTRTVYDPMQSITSNYFYQKWFKEDEGVGDEKRNEVTPFGSRKIVKELHTQYHSIAKMEEIAPMFATW